MLLNSWTLHRRLKVIGPNSNGRGHIWGATKNPAIASAQEQANRFVDRPWGPRPARPAPASSLVVKGVDCGAVILYESEGAQSEGHPQSAR